MRHTLVSGVNVSAMTLGCAQLGMDYGIANRSGMPDERTAFRLLEAAERLGVCAFDTAPAYGGSEATLGGYFKAAGNPHGRCVVTKFQPACQAGADEREVEADLRAQLMQSLARLGLGRVPVYMLHHAGDLRAHGAKLAAALRHLMDEGLVGAAGMSIYDPADAEEALRYDVFRVIQAPLNLFDFRLESLGLLERLVRAGVAVFARSVFLQGLFFLDADRLPEALARAKAPLMELRGIAGRENVPPEQLAVSFVRDMPGVVSAVIGAERPDQVERNAALMDAPAISEGCRERIVRSFRDLPAELINPTLWKK